MNWRIQHVHEIESTNAAALELLHAALTEKVSDTVSLGGTVIFADRQTAGRGQHGRTWISPIGGLYMSAILGDLIAPLRPLAALLTGVAVAQAIEAEGIQRVGLRWPNDVIIDDKKVAGILCQGVASGPQWFCMAGIGANVNMLPTEFPPELAARATTLMACDGKTRNIRSLAQSILHHLTNAMTNSPAQIIEEVRRRDVLLGRQISLRQEDGIITGIANGIDELGAIRLATETGEQFVAIGSVQSIDGIAIR